MPVPPTPLSAPRYFTSAMRSLLSLLAALDVFAVPVRETAAEVTFIVTNTNDSGAGSLRQAIAETNANPGADRIHFNIPGEGVRTITIDSPDPDITDPVTIDGLTQPDASCTAWPPTLLIELTGESSSVDLLNLSDGADGSVIRGLVLNNYSNGIDIQGADEVRIECNFVGTNSAGTSPKQGGGFSEGITMSDASNVVIGGPDPGQRNLISGSGDEEIEANTIFGDVTGLVIQGNFIGTDVTGTTIITEVDEAIDIGASSDWTFSGVLIGGTDHDEGVCNRACNVIAGAEEGIQLVRTSGVTIQGNHIGLDVTGAVVLGGVEEGVSLSNASGTLIGGTDPGAGNVIAGFEEEGIRIFGSEAAPAVGNAILGNSIYGNGLLGIDLMEFGVGTGPTPNDPGDADEGPNRLQNFPVLVAATGDGDEALAVTYSVDTAPANAVYPLRVEFFLADGETDQGVTFLGADSYETADAGQQVGAVLPTAVTVSDGDRIVATATDADGNTSEFSAVIEAVVVENGAPTAQDDASTTDEDVATEIDVLTNDTDPEGDALTVTVTEDPASGTAEVLGDQRIRYTPDQDFFGEDTFTYQIADGHGGSSQAIVTVTVTPVNDAPSAPQITQPQDGADIVVGGASGEDPGDPETTIMIAWSEAVDVDGDPLGYTWQLATDEAFAELLLGRMTGGETTTDLTLAELATVLDAAGVALGAEVVLYHRAVASDGTAETAGSAATVRFVRGALTHTDDGEQPAAFALEANAPNPFNVRTTIRYSLPEASAVDLVVYDMLGRHVTTLLDGTRPAGLHEAVFDASGLPTGVYLYRLEAGRFVQTRRMLVVR